MFHCAALQPLDRGAARPRPLHCPRTEDSAVRTAPAPARLQPPRRRRRRLGPCPHRGPVAVWNAGGGQQCGTGCDMFCIHPVNAPTWLMWTDQERCPSIALHCPRPIRSDIGTARGQHRHRQVLPAPADQAHSGLAARLPWAQRDRNGRVGLHVALGL